MATEDQLILASSSPWRAELLSRLGLPFKVLSPDVDESRLVGESPRQMARRLARIKADTVLKRHPKAFVIGADQVCFIGKKTYSKPGSVAQAKRQLAQMSGQRVQLTSAVCLTSASGTWEDQQTDTVHFRVLTGAQIDAYLKSDPEAIHCAGACRIEASGIVLCQKIVNSDPTGLIGLPLIKLSELLKKAGFKLY